MALRIFQFGILFAIGFCLGPASTLAGAATVKEIPLSIDLQDPQDVIVNKSQSVRIKCTATSSSPDLKISWFHYDKPISNNDTRRSVLEDGTLYIPKVVGGKKKNGVTGEYRCLATNSFGSLLSNPAKLKIASFDRDFNVHPSNLSVSEFQPAVLFCNIHSVPPAQIEWEYNNNPLPHNTRYVPLPTGALLITKTHSSDAGSFRCLATNSILKRTKSSKIVHLTITQSLMNPVDPAILPLDVPSNVTVLIGQNASFYCAVTGSPSPTVRWLNRHDVIVSNSSVLLLVNVTLNDTGLYTCSAHNSGGRTFEKFFLEVHQKPFFNSTPKSLTYPSSGTVRLDCFAKGTPEPKIFWLKNGEPLAFDLRIKKVSLGVIFSHTFSYDSGIYQCVASNAVARIWAAAQMVLFNSSIPSPPEEVKCRSYNESSICLTWKPPRNVFVTAYSIYSYHTAVGPEVVLGFVLGPEYITNLTHQLAYGLNGSTNYTFYVRTYSTSASDDSKRVTCSTGVKGKRNLQITAVNKTAVELKWSMVSTDVPCDGTKVTYKIQWRRRGRPATPNYVHTDKFALVIADLTPSMDYEFRVTSIFFKNDNSRWTPIGIDEPLATTNPLLEMIPHAPVQLEVNKVSTTAVNISWDDPNDSSKYYSVCYYDVQQQFVCDESKERYLLVSNLHPDTFYEFKVRAHNDDDYASPYSQTIEVRTASDVPSSVLDLKYKVVNESAVCLQWEAPTFKNGKLTKYVISYTPDRDRPLEEWICHTVSANPKKTKSCSLEPGSISALLANLTPDQHYTVLVRAATEVGLGKPAMPISVTTNNIIGANGENHSPEPQNTFRYSQKLGIIVGVAIAIVCVIICASCILVRKKCLKSRALARARLAASNNYYPAVAHYASEGSSVQVRLEDPCSAEIHEIEHLVSDDSATQIQADTTAHLDSKGIDGYPNGYLNGSAKPYVNGNALNGSVHITENPRYYALECNGDKNQKPRFEQDSNSNLKTSKFLDLHRIFETSKLQSPCTAKRKSNQCNSKANDSCSPRGSLEDTLNSTQVTCLDNSFIVPVNNRRVSPILGPNG